MGLGNCSSVKTFSRLSTTALTELSVINTFASEVKKASNISLVNSVLTL